MIKRGLLIVLSGPSGAGKGTVLNSLIENNSNIKVSISATTRYPREGEIHGKHYYFINKEEFESLIRSNGMLEYAKYCDNYYGTPRSNIEKWLEDGIDVILEIEVQGGAQVKKLCPESVSVFVMPPSMGVLEKRLVKRNTDHPDVMTKRLNTAKKEIETAVLYDYVIVNDHLEDCVKDLETVIKAEKFKTKRNIKFIEGVLKNA